MHPVALAVDGSLELDGEQWQRLVRAEGVESAFGLGEVVGWVGAGGKGGDADVEADVAQVFSGGECGGAAGAVAVEGDDCGRAVLERDFGDPAAVDNGERRSACRDGQQIGVAGRAGSGWRWRGRRGVLRR